MSWADITLGGRQWLIPAILLVSAGLGVLIWRYRQAATTSGVRGVCLLLKAAAFILLGICLLDPLFTGKRPRPGSNLFLILADNSRSLQLSDRAASKSRGEEVKLALASEAEWLTRLGQDFDVRRYQFDTTLQPVKEFDQLKLDGDSSALATSLTSLVQRYRGQPIAGVLLFSDGNATDLSDQPLEMAGMPPVYPVAVAGESGQLDVSVAQVSVSQTNFEAAPVTIVAEVEGRGLGTRKVVVRILDEARKELERRTLPGLRDGERQAQRFLIKPEKPGVSFYHVVAGLEGEEKLLERPGKSREATLANNQRLATVDRGGGPYRVLYVSGLPNWEYKFLRRAIEKDDEVHLVGLVRIAKKEPKFTFLGRQGERTNPLFRGFGNDKDQTAEQYDEPVLLRLGTEDQDELRGGFPKDADDLFQYHAVVLDDIEAEFFTQDQLSLLQRFVSQRGGGLLMMGGRFSFAEGGYARTQVAEMLPVYLDRSAPVAAAGGYRLRLTREGWLQPWVRTRDNEAEENTRLQAMPGFYSVNRVHTIKPGASVLAEVENSAGAGHPALVVQPFGRGRAGALLIGDLWRWDLRRPDVAQSDLEKSWRQTIRWLVSDVPQPVEMETRSVRSAGLPATEIVVRARDKQFSPLDNAAVNLTIQTPDNRELSLVAESSIQAAGEYRTQFIPRLPGAYRVQAVVAAADGSDVGQRETGFAVEPETDEFRQLNANQALLDRLANESGGEVIPLAQLDQFVSSLPNRKIPVVESWTYPLWHQWGVLMLAIGCLVGEWGIRRWRGLP